MATNRIGTKNRRCYICSLSCETIVYKVYINHGLIVYFSLRSFTVYITHDHAVIYENKMNIGIPLCNVWHLNGFLKFSLEIFLKKTQLLTGKQLF